MDRLFNRGGAKVDEENPYWMSFSDLMSGLLVIFILAAVALIIELTQKSEKIDASIEELQKAEQARKDILTDIQDDLDKQNIHVEIVENHTNGVDRERTWGKKFGTCEIFAIDKLTCKT